MDKNKYLSVSALPIMVMFCVGIYAVPLQLMRAELTFIPGDLADTRLCNYFLEHGYQWLTGKVESFWNAPFYYPTLRTMAFSENFLGTLPIYALFRIVHFDRETSFQLWFFAVFVLNYFSCAWVLKKFSLSPLGIAAGAYIFTFSLPIIARMVHSQLLPRFMIPIAFYFAFKYLENRDEKAFLLACLSVVLQFYCSIYLGIFLVLGLSFFVIAYSLQHRKRPILREVFWGSPRAFFLKILVLCLASLLLLPMLLPYYQTSLEYGVRSWDEIKLMLPRIQSYLTPANGSLLWNWLTPMASRLPMAHEHQIFIGAIPLLSVICMPLVYRRFRSEPLMQLGMMMFITFMIIACTTLYFRNTPYKVMSLLPGLRSVRVVTRIMLMNSFLIALITGVLLTKIQASRPAFSKYPANIFFSFLVISAVAADQYVQCPGYMSYSKSEAQQRTKFVERLVINKERRAKIIAYMPDKLADPPYFVHIDAMMAAQDLNMSTINGYSGIFPHGYDESFFDHYDRCDELFKWLAMARMKYADRENGHVLFSDIVVAGRDTCIDANHAYSYMSAALPEGGYRATITLTSSGITVTRGQVITTTALAKNAGSAKWASLNDQGGKYKICLSYRWLSPDHTPMGGFDARSPLPYDVQPGETASFSLNVNAPALPGTYYLEFDMVQELVAWFHDKGSSTSLLKIVVL